MRFEQSGDWPNAERLQRQVTRVHDDLDVIDCAESLPGRLGNYLPDGRISLSVRALAYVDDADELIGDFVRTLRLAVRRYRDEDASPSPVLRESDLASLVSDPGRLRRLLALLIVERAIFAEVEGGTAAVRITPEARHFVGVRTLEDYLRVRERLARKSMTRRRRGVVTRLPRWFRRRQVSIGEWIVIGLVSSLGAAICVAIVGAL